MSICCSLQWLQTRSTGYLMVMEAAVKALKFQCSLGAWWANIKVKTESTQNQCSASNPVLMMLDRFYTVIYFNAKMYFSVYVVFSFTCSGQSFCSYRPYPSKRCFLCKLWGPGSTVLRLCTCMKGLPEDDTRLQPFQVRYILPKLQLCRATSLFRYHCSSSGIHREFFTKNILDSHFNTSAGQVLLLLSSLLALDLDLGFRRGCVHVQYEQEEWLEGKSKTCFTIHMGNWLLF